MRPFAWPLVCILACALAAPRSAHAQAGEHGKAKAEAKADGGKTAGKPLGQLGQTLRDVGIHTRMTERSPVSYRTHRHQYLVVSPTTSAAWTSVALVSGGKGYVPTDAVKVLPFNVLQGPKGPFSRANGPRPGGEAGARWRTPQDAVDLALEFVGRAPYRAGGRDPSTGVDAAGFVKAIFAAIGVDLPQRAAKQADFGKPVARLEHLQPGDRLYFWSARLGEIGDTGIYAGNGYFVHASKSEGTVVTSGLTKSWLKLLVAARR